MLRLILTSSSVALLTATYLYFYGDGILDAIIEHQKKVKGGFYKKINRNEKCPNCGLEGGFLGRLFPRWDLVCTGEITWNAQLERCIHGCKQCGATWPEKPRIPSNVWDLVGKMIKHDAEHAEDIKSVFEQANRPIVLKGEPKKEQVQ